MSFNLDAKLHADTHHICDLKLCRVLLMNEQNYPWVILVPMKNGAVEITDLSQEDQHQLLAETTKVMDVLKSLTDCTKLNVANLGNVVSQLHVHVVARFETDAAWPAPIWGKADPVAYEETDATGMVAVLKARLLG